MKGENDDDNLDLESQGDRVLSVHLLLLAHYVYLQHFMNLGNPVRFNASFFRTKAVQEIGNVHDWYHSSLAGMWCQPIFFSG